MQYLMEYVQTPSFLKLHEIVSLSSNFKGFNLSHQSKIEGQQSAYVERRVKCK